MLKKAVFTDSVTCALETASVLRAVVFAIDSLEDGLAGSPHVHLIGDIRRTVQASAKHIDNLAEDLDRIDCKYFGAGSA